MFMSFNCYNYNLAMCSSLPNQNIMLSKEPGYGLFSEDIHYRIATQGRKGHRKTFVNQEKKKNTQKTNHLRKTNCTHFLYFILSISMNQMILQLDELDQHAFHLCVLLAHTIGFMRKSVHPQDSLFMKYEGGPEDFIWSGYGSLTTSEVLM